MRILALFFLSLAAHAAELQTGDIVAFIGGEEMVTAAETSEIEWALVTAAPELGLTFRSLAWEGDTVYTQRRDLNYPTLAAQLDQIAATVVFVQFGQMETLDGPARLPEFTAAYEKLLTSLGARRFVLLLPHPFTAPEDEGSLDLTPRNDDLEAYAAAIRALAKRRGWAVAEWNFTAASAVTALTRDGIHLNAWGETMRALGLASRLLPERVAALAPVQKSPPQEALLQLLRAKNRLWFNYYRPQNWAFLAGDRTNQPSSRDHLDPTKRWFPGELEQFLPLIAEKERAIRAATP